MEKPQEFVAVFQNHHTIITSREYGVEEEDFAFHFVSYIFDWFTLFALFLRLKER